MKPDTSYHPTYSIIIPCYNAEKTVRIAVKSCLQQSHPPHEIILVDDGSKDSTPAILKELESTHSLISIKILANNTGVSAARNAGWAMATGDYVVFLDSDDSFHSEKLKTITQYISHYGEEVYWHDYRYVLSNKFDENKLPHVSPSVELTSFGRLLLGSPVSTCTLIIPRKYDMRFDEKMRYCEDHDLVLRLAHKKSLIHIPIQLTHVHREINSQGGLSGHIWLMRQGEMYMYKKLYQLNIMYIGIIPILWLYSLLKHFRLLLKR